MIACTICTRPAAVASPQLNEFRIPQVLCVPCAELARALNLPRMDHRTDVEWRL